MNKRTESSGAKRSRSRRALQNPAEPDRPLRKKSEPEPFTAEELRRISQEISTMPRPESGASRLGLLEVDPWNVHAWWHIAADDMAAGRARLPGDSPDAVLVLRFSDVSPRQGETAQPHKYFDIEVSEDRNSWYVNLWRDAKRYAAEIGLRTSAGAFVGLASSNEVATPRAGPSPDLDFVRTEVRVPGLPEPGLPVPPAIAGDILLRDLFPSRSLEADEFPLIDVDSFAHPVDTLVFPGQGTAALPTDIWDQDASWTTEIEPAGFEEGMAGDVASADELGLPMLASVEMDRYAGRAIEFKDQMLSEIEPPSLPPVAEASIAPTGLDLRTSPLPIPSQPTVNEPPPVAPVVLPHTEESASAPPPQPVALETVLGEHGFYTAMPAEGEVSASVVIEGRYPPDTPLFLFGEPVARRQDGGFSLRLPLEPGADLVALVHRLSKRPRKE